MKHPPPKIKKAAPAKEQPNPLKVTTPEGCRTSLQVSSQRELLKELVRAFPSWPFRPEHSEMVQRIRQRLDAEERMVTE